MLTNTRSSRKTATLAICAILAFAGADSALAQSNQTPGAQAPAGQQGAGDLQWPRTFDTPSGAQMTLHQPQVTAWSNYTDLTAMIAAEYGAKGADSTAAGVIGISAKTVADQDAGTVVIYDIAVDNLNFSTLGRDALADAALEVGKILPTGSVTMSLDRVTTSLADYARLQETTGLQADPPPIFVETVPAILVQTNGSAVSARVELVDGLSFVVNTNWDILKTDEPSAYFLRDGKSWLTANDLTDEWQPADTLPDIFNDLPDNDNWKDAKAAIPPQPFDGPAPKVAYSDKPAEMIVIDGQPQLDPIAGTDLAWVSNTQSDLFYLNTDKNWYFLTSGRWFRAADLSGPWSFATPDLPADFRRIPAGQPYSSVRASIPGTSESDEARLQASIPQTARVERNNVTIEVTYSGDPEFVRIEGTSLFYAVNTSFTVIRVGDQYYVCDGGVWFVGSSPTGPFVVVDTVPDEIYAIPSSSPVYNVTYVRVYASDPAAVWFGFTAGYLWGYLAWDTYVYGTGYYYPPYWYRGPLYPPIYYPRTVTYGGGIYYTANGGWGRYGYAYGPYRGVEAGGYYNPDTGRYVRGAAAYGPYGQRGYIAAGNVNTGRRVVAHGGTNPYATWGSVGVTNGSDWAVARGYSNQDGGRAVGWNTSGGNRGFAGKTANSDLYAGRDGNVYRKTDDGWQKYDDGGWTPVNPPDSNSLTSLGADQRGQDRDLSARRSQAGDQQPGAANQRGQDRNLLSRQSPADGHQSQPRARPDPSTRQLPQLSGQTPARPAQQPAGQLGQIQPESGGVLQNLDRSFDNRQRGNARVTQGNPSLGERVGQRQGASTGQRRWRRRR